jgi:hypothetical protein
LVWELVFTGNWAVSIAKALAPFVNVKLAGVCVLAGITVASILAARPVFRFSKAYLGGLFDAEGCICFNHIKTIKGFTYSYLVIDIAQKNHDFNKSVAGFLKDVCGKAFTFTGGHVRGSGTATYAFYEQFVVEGFSIRKGFKLFACITAWFPRGKSVKWGSLSATVPAALLMALPTFPSNDKKGTAGEPHRYAIHASRYKVYLEHGPVECKVDSNGPLPVLRRGVALRIPGMSDGQLRGKRIFSARPALLQLKAAFHQ